MTENPETNVPDDQTTSDSEIIQDSLLGKEETGEVKTGEAKEKGEVQEKEPEAEKESEKEKPRRRLPGFELPLALVAGIVVVVAFFRLGRRNRIK